MESEGATNKHIKMNEIIKIAGNPTTMHPVPAWTTLLAAAFALTRSPLRGPAVGCNYRLAFGHLGKSMV